MYSLLPSACGAERVPTRRESSITYVCRGSWCLPGPWLIARRFWVPPLCRNEMEVDIGGIVWYWREFRHQRLVVVVVLVFPLSFA